MNKIGVKKQKLIDDFNNQPIIVGEIVDVPYSAISTCTDKNTKRSVKVLEVLEDDFFMVIDTEKTYSTINPVKVHRDKITRNTRNIGHNPFKKKSTGSNIRVFNFSIESILSMLCRRDNEYKIGNTPILNINWNPFVFDENGNKVYYQRDFCWTLEDKRLLIDSIYNDIECGKILIRKRSWDELELMVKNGETEISFNDIVDGKQRLNTLNEFVDDKFTDSNGFYYSDLSNRAQHLFLSNQLITYCEMYENTKDADVIEQFLKMNFTGIPQSKEHIDFVKSIKVRE